MTGKALGRRNIVLVETTELNAKPKEALKVTRNGS